MAIDKGVLEGICSPADNVTIFFFFFFFFWTWKRSALVWQRSLLILFSFCCFQALRVFQRGLEGISKFCMKGGAWRRGQDVASSFTFVLLFSSFLLVANDGTY